MKRRRFLTILISFILAASLSMETVMAGELTDAATEGSSAPSVDEKDVQDETEVDEETVQDDGDVKVLSKSDGDGSDAAEKQERVIKASDVEKVFGAESFSILEEPIDDADVTFASSSKSVASVDDNGMVTCKKVGSAVITIYAAETDEYLAAEKEVTVTVVSSLKQGNITDVTTESGKVTLTWKKISGAEGYQLYRRTSSEDSYTLLTEVTGADKLSYTDKTAKSGVIYYYKVRGYASDKNDVGEKSEKKKVKMLGKPTLSLKKELTGTQLTWTSIGDAGGYRIYRRASTKKDYTLVDTVEGYGVITWRDTSAKNGTMYYYKVSAYYGDGESARSEAKKYVYLKAPSVKKWARKSATKMQVSWSGNSSASGYEIQYATNRFFGGAKKKTIKKGSTTSASITKLKKNTKYYVRVRAYKKQDGKTYYSAWKTNAGVNKTKTAKASLVKKKKKTLELRSLTKQKMYGYDTVQGSCNDGKYAYYVLYNRNLENCKVAKVKMSNNKLVKVSKVLALDHGNDITYDSDKKLLAAAHGSSAKTKKMTYIDPKALKVKENKTVSIPTQLAGASKSQAKSISGFSGIAYSSGRQQYVAMLGKSHNFLILDKDLNPLRYVKASEKWDYTMQGIEATADYIMVSMSPNNSKQQNVIMVYDWDGNFHSKINVKKGYELEGIYRKGGRLYANFYTSYYKTQYRYEVKKVKVKGKKRNKLVKTPYYVLRRDNYVYKLSSM